MELTVVSGGVVSVGGGVPDRLIPMSVPSEAAFLPADPEARAKPAYVVGFAPPPNRIVPVIGLVPPEP